MDTIKSAFEDRKKEINLYFTLLNCFNFLEEGLTSEKHNEIFKNKDLEKILRAHSILMLYNLIESTFISAIEVVYEAFKENNLTYSNVRKEIKEEVILFMEEFIIAIERYYNNQEYLMHSSSQKKTTPGT